VELDALDRKTADAFAGLVVRKDLVRQFRGQFPVPTYVVEFMLGRYCATTDEQEIAEGLELVRTQLSSRTVRAGEEEGVKFKARDAGAVRIIDVITARLEARSDSYLATLPSLRLTDVRISDPLVRENERMLTGGFYAEIDLGYDATIAQEKGGSTVSDERGSADPALDPRHPRPDRRGPDKTRYRAVEGFPAAEHRPRARSAVGARATSRSCAWFPSSNATTTSLSSGCAVPARAISSNRFRLTRIWSRAERRRSPACLSTWQPGNAGWFANMTWSASTRYRACPSTRRTASTS
jgi:hypothetical protein